MKIQVYMYYSPGGAEAGRYCGLEKLTYQICILSTQPANKPKRHSFPQITIYHNSSLVTFFFFDKVARLGMNMRNFQYLMLIHQFRKSVARIKRLLVLGCCSEYFLPRKVHIENKTQSNMNYPGIVSSVFFITVFFYLRVSR